jgi:pimeloyl-ACP methyl ester carboxylesterase
MKSTWNRREFLTKVPAAAAGAAALVQAASPAAGAQETARRAVDDGVEREYIDFRAEDNGASYGLYYRRKGTNPKTAVLLMHPNANNTNHFLTRRLAAAGYGVLGTAGRFASNPARGIPDATLLDIAAHIKYLKKNYGVEHIVLAGHSGGGGLYAYYQAQATTAPPGRYNSTPAGDPPDLNKFEMPPADGMIMISAHEGEGYIALYRLDPSVVDEDDPLAADPELDMYDLRNGYRPPPESSRYSQEFITRYKAAQMARMKRLEAKAFDLIARQRRAQEQMKSPGFAQLDPKDQMAIRRTAALEPYMVTCRDSAMLSMADLSIDPNDRKVGNGEDPERPNFVGASGQAGVMSARGFLATWSFNYTRMKTKENLAKITVPTLIMVGTADLDETPNIIKQEHEICAAKDKTFAMIKGANHGYGAVEPAAGGKNTQDEAAKLIAGWLKPRFPA